jgi:hypothetical protein
VLCIHEQGVNIFIEPGPDKVLGDMISRIIPGSRNFPLRNSADLAKIIKELALVTQ